MEVDQLAVGVGKLEVGESLSNLGASRMPVREPQTTGMTQRRGGIETVVIAFYCHALSLDDEMLRY